MAERADLEYSTRERLCLGLLAAVGFGGLNAVFLYVVAREPETIGATLSNPLATVFMAEAFLLAGLLAYLLDKWKVSRVHWAWFIALSLVGSIAFALPVVLLVTWYRGRARGTETPGAG